MLPMHPDKSIPITARFFTHIRIPHQLKDFDTSPYTILSRGSFCLNEFTPPRVFQTLLSAPLKQYLIFLSPDPVTLPSPRVAWSAVNEGGRKGNNLRQTASHQNRARVTGLIVIYKYIYFIPSIWWPGSIWITWGWIHVLHSLRTLGVNLPGWRERPIGQYSDMHSWRW